MLDAIDAIFLVFAFITLYFMAFFLIANYSRKKEEPAKDFFGSVSFLIPAYNEAGTIAATVNAIKETDYPTKEIIVVDDGSTDGTAAEARKAGAIVLSVKNRGKAAALNRARKKARGDFIACVDADSFLTKNALKEAMKYFADPGVAAVTVSILPRNKKGLLARLQEFEYIMIAWARKNLEYVESVFVTPGPMSIYRKNVIEKLGGFDETNLTEDIEIAWRVLNAGYKIRMATKALVYTETPTALRTWWRQRTRWNIGGMQTLWKYRHEVFSNEATFAMFVIPFFAFSMGISLMGLGVFTFLICQWAVSSALFLVGAQAAGVTPQIELLLLPNVFTIFGLLIFGLSLLYSKINFAAYNRRFTDRKDYAVMLVYLAFYISIFPILLVYSAAKMLAGKREW
ncbi:MAG: glycosyltransferase family 2 protein [Candidatus Aenigmarchaeota archaeon]|nr:glycosyltransferase family 2 protein [Candidatus Aenigmarchaeota archaeon]